VKLLRVLQNGSLSHWAAAGRYPWTYAIIAATNRNLEEAVKLDAFGPICFTG